MRIRVAGDKLTERQAKIVSLVAEGYQAKEIGPQIGMTTSMVNNALRSAFKATTARNAPALVAMALREGWIS